MLQGVWLVAQHMPALTVWIRGQRFGGSCFLQIQQKVLDNNSFFYFECEKFRELKTPPFIIEAKI